MKNFTYPIAMRCNQEQFESIKPELEKMGYQFETFADWEDCPYLTNRYNMKFGVMSNVLKDLDVTSRKGRQVFNTWNADLFLALAAITNSDKPEYGEYFYRTSKDEIVGVINKPMYVAKETHPEFVVDEDGETHNLMNIEKATPEQIINYFTNNKKQENMETKEFTKADLKTGMIAEFQDGHLGLFIHTTFITLNHGGVSLDFLDDKLMGVEKLEYSIHKIYELDKSRNYNASMNFWLLDKNFLDYATLLWERNDTVEMTVEEISKALGKKVKVVASK